MKVVGINGSSRADGNTFILINTVLEELRKEGIDTEMIQLFDKDVKPCRGCGACKNGSCILENDGFKRIFDKMAEADGIILGSPVYSADVSARMKALLERAGAGYIAAMNPELMRHKVGAAVAAVRRGGGMTAVDAMNHFFLNKEIFVAGSTYWNMVYGKDAGDVLKDEEGMHNMKNLGQNMAYLLKKLHAND